jgi:hypothetical protein
MGPEVQQGVVTRAELDVLAGTRSELKRYLHAQPSRRTAARVLDAENDLAHQIARAGGKETEDVQQAREAVAQARVS